MEKLPAKTVERLSGYRRTLINCLHDGKEYIYSHELAGFTTKRLCRCVGIITVPPEYAKEIAERLIAAGIKGILNLTTIPLNVPEEVYLEEYDMITSLEKVAYFARVNE